MLTVGSEWESGFDQATVLNRVTAANASGRVRFNSSRFGVEVSLFGDDEEAVSATVVARRSLGGVYRTGVTFVLSGTGAGASSPAEPAMRAFHSPFTDWEFEVTAISGTGAGVDVKVQAERK